MTTTVVAEAGVNHNGDLTLAMRLVEAAVEAGADFVKFQTFSAVRLATVTASKAAYQHAATGSVESQLNMLRRLELDPAAHRALVARCAELRIGFLSTAFDVESVDFVIDLGVPLLKIPSGDITNLPYLRHVGSQGKPVLMSTGMATMSEVGNAMTVLENAGLPRSEITLLHCTTEYPTPMEDVNLRAMTALRDAFGVAVGYSDHTRGIEVPVAAVALGATVIEKHFTLDRDQVGPDHRASLEPDELRAMITAIRNIEVALGDGNKSPKAGELENARVARKSLVAARDIRAGEPFSAENLAVKRPGTGVSPMRWDDAMGRIARRNYAADELIEL